jgi:hypothetical protein
MSQVSAKSKKPYKEFPLNFGYSWKATLVTVVASLIVLPLFKDSQPHQVVLAVLVFLTIMSLISLLRNLLARQFGYFINLRGDGDPLVLHSSRPKKRTDPYKYNFKKIIW